MSFWYDKQGKLIAGIADFDNPTEKKRWHRDMKKVESLLTDVNYKRVAATEVKIGRKKYWVSTVWLGLDHSFSWSADKPNPCPIIFETMIFNNSKDDDSALSYQTRYCTEAEALEGHEKAIEWLKNEQR